MRVLGFFKIFVLNPLNLKEEQQMQVTAITIPNNDVSYFIL